MSAKGPVTERETPLMIHRAMSLPALLAAVAACGNPRPATQAASPAPGAPAATDTIRTDSAAPNPGVADTAAAHAVPAPARAQRPPAAALEGSWFLRTVEPNRRGPRLQLAVDSVSDSTFRVRVAFLMQGDVGLDPSRFEPTRGAIAPDGTVHLSIRLKGRTEPTGTLVGVLVATGDTIRLGTYQWGGANQAAGGVHWLLVRER